MNNQIDTDDLCLRRRCFKVCLEEEDMEPVENKRKPLEKRKKMLLEQCNALADIYFANYDDPDKPLAKSGLMSMLKSEVNGMTVDQFADFERKVNNALIQPATFLARAWGDEGHELR